MGHHREPNPQVPVASTGRSASVDGNAITASGGERFSVPTSPALLQPQPGDPRHEIELARPRIPGDDWIQAYALSRQGHVALFEELLHGIVASHIQPHLADSYGFCIDVLIVAQAVEKVRHA